MTRTAHLTSGAILSTAAALYYYEGGYSVIQLPLSWLGTFIIAIMVGSTAPDWMEIPRHSKFLNKRVSLIPHRTLTHWLLPWAGVFMYSLYQWINANAATFDPMWIIILGFSMGGLMHCILDWMTPKGIPVVAPFIFRNGSMYLVRGMLGEIVTMIILAIITIGPIYNGWIYKDQSRIKVQSEIEHVKAIKQQNPQ